MASTQGDYAFDLVEGELAISSSDYAQNIVISTSFTRFRKVKYLRPEDYSIYLKWRDPAKIFTEKAPGRVGLEQLDCFYRAGDNIVFKLSNLQDTMLYGFYQYPLRVSDPNATNNYMTQMPAAIHAIAASMIWEDIGNEAEAQRLERRGLRLLAMHQADKQDGVSHS